MPDNIFIILMNYIFNAIRKQIILFWKKDSFENNTVLAVELEWE